MIPVNQPRTFPARVERKRSDWIEQITVNLTGFHRLHRLSRDVLEVSQTITAASPTTWWESPRSIPPGSGRFWFPSRSSSHLVEIGEQTTRSSRVSPRAW